jgi:hypothetical protein
MRHQSNTIDNLSTIGAKHRSHIFPLRFVPGHIANEVCPPWEKKLHRFPLCFLRPRTGWKFQSHFIMLQQQPLKGYSPASFFTYPGREGMTNDHG